MPRSRAALIVAAVLAACVADAALARHPHSGARTTQAAAAHFDYYVMALSWSPTFCELQPDDAGQCAHKGYGFVLHGLWPQYENGGGPKRCASDDEPDRKTVAAALAFMPDKRLIAHEWHAHGACTGLDPAAYFTAADRAFAALRIPPGLEAPRTALTMSAEDLRGALKRANPGLRDDMMSVHCSQGELAEVRVCLDKDLALRSCGKRMRNGCPAATPLRIPASK